MTILLDCVHSLSYFKLPPFRNWR